MTETQYLQADIAKLIDTTKDKQKKVLFNLACYRHVEITNSELLDLLVTIEDNIANSKKLRKLQNQARRLALQATNFIDYNLFWGLQYIFDVAYLYAIDICEDSQIERLYQRAVFHDIFPYKTPKIPINQNIYSIAQTLHETNNFEDIGILHDALLDENADSYVLNHLNQPFHTKYCWIIQNIIKNRFF